MSAPRDTTRVSRDDGTFALLAAETLDAITALPGAFATLGVYLSILSNADGTHRDDVLRDLHPNDDADEVLAALDALVEHRYIGFVDSSLTGRVYYPVNVEVAQ